MSWNLAITLALGASAALYATGSIRVWRHAGRDHGIRHLNVIAFAAGLGALWIALLSPLAGLSDILFSAHMGQHELLMLVAAPLVVMGKPWIPAAWALPAPHRARGSLDQKWRMERCHLFVIGKSPTPGWETVVLPWQQSRRARMIHVMSLTRPILSKL